MDDLLSLVGRQHDLLSEDLVAHQEELDAAVRAGRFLVIGGAGSIGQAVVKELFARSPRSLHVVDLSENNLVELVRDIRSSVGYMEGDFRTFAVDAGSPIFESLFQSMGPYDYILNLSALKHVRSEKDPFTLMRMIEVNILNVDECLRMASAAGVGKYFAVSSDKAANPANMMGASKRVMEMLLVASGNELPISTARFANVAFSDGSLLYGFGRRLAKRQPLSAPTDVTRYFISDTESGELCLLSCILGRNGEIFFPKLSSELNLVTFSSIAERFLRWQGLEPHMCETEDEARARVDELSSAGKWPCYFFESDTTGEKDFEEFYVEGEQVDWERFAAVGVVENAASCDPERLQDFLREARSLIQRGRWSRAEILELLHSVLPQFAHRETGKYLDDKM
ncbi:MAG: UDP-N-acetylglucosamine 4,6-dehydratase [Gemmatimonadetes bacterium]|nr:UDP-N-acetylglucosamine 4,6-dehydratase [Gemmatimonadota bacterium]MCK5482677.1 UDP-N-acetylglucosamine 4,6-dehydratase [Gemmatimonadota bacterium]